MIDDDDDHEVADHEENAPAIADVTDPSTIQEALRVAEALVFASAEPVGEAFIAERLPLGIDVPALMQQLKEDYATRGVNLVQVDNHWAFRTAADLSFAIRKDDAEVRKLSRAALEVMAIIAYHQPVTRAEIEEIRGVQTSKGTLDVLMEAGWVRFRGRRRSPGRPVTIGTTRDFLDHFGLEELRDLPGMEELKAAGMLSGRIPPNLNVPLPSADDELDEDEDPISQLELEELGLLAPKGDAED